MRARRIARILYLPLVLVFVIPAAAGPAGSQRAKGSFRLVGHDPLMMRGMNAALAVHGDYAYVGSRTDAKPGNVNNAGILVVDISNPRAPEVVYQMGPPDQANSGETSREMRIWPDEGLLIVQNLGSNCSELIHECSPIKVSDNFRFYDIRGKNAAQPKLVAEYDPSQNPHEFFLWDDPRRKGRALLFLSTPGGNQDLVVTDISDARKGEFDEIAAWQAEGFSGSLHSLSVTNDGTRAFMAYLDDGFIVADTTDLALSKPNAEVRQITPANNRPIWPGPGAHSAVKVWGKNYILVTDEVYGDAITATSPTQPHGCPWGWTRILDVKNPKKPKVVAEYRLPQNQEDFCTTDPPRPSSSYAAHNPTLTEHIAFISWHAGGLQAVSIASATKPVQLAAFVPEPLPIVFQEDPALSFGQDKVVVWSYPIIKDGLIYVVDLRNGLYILEYTGSFEKEVSTVDFLEGNSNLGDALRFERP